MDHLNKTHTQDLFTNYLNALGIMNLLFKQNCDFFSLSHNERKKETSKFKNAPSIFHILW